MKRLCILLGGHFSNAQGGAEYQAGCIAEEVAKRGGYEVFYLARAIHPSYQPPGYQLVQITGENWLNRKAFFFDAFDLYRVLSDIQPDVIYQRGLMAYTGVAAWYAKRHGCRLVFHIAHDFDVSSHISFLSKGKLLKAIDRRVGEYGIRRADAIIAQTHWQNNLLKSYYGREATAVIGNFHPLPVEEIEKSGAIKVVWVANFKPNKRPEMFVRLAEALRHIADIEFIMIGHPGSQKRYSNLYRQMEKLENLQFLGLQPLNKVNEILAKSHIFVNTSVKEGFPNTFVQAWMRQVPVVSLDVDLDGVLAAGRIGFLSGSYEQLKKDVERLILNGNLRSSMGIEARDYAFENHSPRIFERLFQVIDH